MFERHSDSFRKWSFRIIFISERFKSNDNRQVRTAIEKANENKCSYYWIVFVCLLPRIECIFRIISAIACKNYFPVDCVLHSMTCNGNLFTFLKVWVFKWQPIDVNLNRKFHLRQPYQSKWILYPVPTNKSFY